MEQEFIGHVAYRSPVCAAAEVEKGFDKGTFVAGKVGPLMTDKGFYPGIKCFNLQLYNSLIRYVLNKSQRETWRWRDDKVC